MHRERLEDCLQEGEAKARDVIKKEVEAWFESEPKIEAEVGYQNPRTYQLEGAMLSWALTFFILALIAAVLGFTGIAGAAAGIAKLLFYIFLILLVISFFFRAVRGQPPV